MAKNQKKSISLSMGGVLPRKLKPEQASIATAKTKILKIKKDQTDKKREKIKKPAFSWLKLRNNFVLIVLSLFIAGLYLFDINHFPPLQHPGNIYHSGSDINSADYLPAKIILLALSKLHINFSVDLRVLSVVIMLFSVFCFYKLASTWISRRMSAISTLLFSSSTWVLTQTRTEGISVMMLALIPVLLYAGSLLVNSKSNFAKVFLVIILLQLIFIPGAIWFLILAGIICLFYFKNNLDLRSILAPLIAVLLIASVDAALVYHFSLVKLSELERLAGLNSTVVPSLHSMINNAANLPNQLFFSGINDSSLWLYPTPIIDWVSLVLMLAGLIYLVSSNLHPARKKIIFSFIVLSLVLIIINGSAFISILLPVLYLAIAAGITYLLQQWLVIFPNNPLARYLGFALVCCIALLICGFHIGRYFVGWPKTDAYHHVYRD